MTTPTVRPEYIDTLATSVYPAFAMLAGMELDLFTPLKDGPLTADQVAQALGLREDKLNPLLYALVAAGLLNVEGHLFSNSQEADDFLVRGKDEYVGGRHRAIRNRWAGILRTAETIRTGSPQAATDFASMSVERMESLARSRETESTSAARELMARYDFSRYKSLLDVGGGGGHLSIEVAEAHPGLRATLLDLPSVTPIAQKIVSESRCADRVQVVTADVVNESISGSFDVAVVKSFVQVLSVNQARDALKNVGRAIQPGGTVFIVGHVIDDSRITPLETVGMNLFFLNTFDEGQAYTEQEHREWLSEAGLIDGFERVWMSNGMAILKVNKPV